MWLNILHTVHIFFILKPKSLTLACSHSLSFVFICCTTRCHSPLSFVVTHCHSLPLVVTRCTTRCHLLSFVVSILAICCHSLSFVVTRCHLLSLVVALVVTRRDTGLSFYKRSYYVEIRLNFFCNFIKYSILFITSPCQTRSMEFIFFRKTIFIEIYRCSNWNSCTSR